MRASRLPVLSCATSQWFGMVLVLLSRLFARCLALEGLSRSERLSPFLGTPILGSPLREVSGLRACSSWQPT
ncbi:hypothetical protein Taro_046838 [Colocasia esculenta]|uniref:Uncharacterized protein n=1 Tax=Colocasia esculenta TaxID=4460 RepID=A0A843X4N5_COLES|nr:hypothetical protein [Colocasia esculenta]